MKYITQVKNAVDNVVLADFSKIEGRCAISLEELHVGDDVIVIYQTRVVAVDGKLEIPLHPDSTPVIVKPDNFIDFVEKFEENRAKQPPAIASNVTDEVNKPAEPVVL